MLIPDITLPLFWLSSLWIPMVAAAWVDDIAPYQAMYFYFGYLHEHASHDGHTTIGGRECRAQTACTFDEFLDATTRNGGQGGYEGGATLHRDLNDKKAYGLAQDLKDKGMTDNLRWDRETLISNAPRNAGIPIEYVAYVRNSIIEDRFRGGASAQYRRLVNEAQRHMAELLAPYISDNMEGIWRAEAPDETEFDMVTLPSSNDTTEGEIRNIIDVVTLAKTWGKSVPEIFLSKPARDVPTRNPAAGLYAMQIAAFRGC